MKEFIKNNKITYNLMSFTAFKTLLIFSLLLESPKSYEDIIDYFESHDFINEKISIDTVRVYLNSLKKAGCVITKTKRSEGSKFVLASHPFELTITPEQIKVISRVYKSISKTVNITELIMLERFMRNIADSVRNAELKALLNKISVLSGMDVSLLESLNSCCLNKRQIVLRYNSPRSGHTSLEIICDKMAFDNGRLYLYGTSIDYSQSSYLLVARIIKIQEIKLKKDTNINIPELIVRYEVDTTLQEFQLKDFEKLLLHTGDGKILVEAISSNKFALKQRILSLSNACTVVEPKDFRDEIIQTLKEMRAEY